MDDSMTTTATIGERVRRGALLLDMSEPGWAERIIQSELNIARCDRCVLGQVYGTFGRGSRALDLWDDDREAEFGFDASCDWIASGAREAAEFAALATAWLAEIRARIQPTAEGDEADDHELAAAGAAAWQGCPRDRLSIP